MAAQGVARILSTVSLRCCSFEENPIRGARAVDCWLPLLQLSVHSAIKEVKAFSIAQLVKLCEVGGNHLKPHLGGLIVTLLEISSTFEPEELNYLQFHTDKLQMTPDSLESMRLNMSSVATGPVNSALDVCLRLTTDDVADVLGVKLAALMRTSTLPLSTKGCLSRFIMNLSIANPSLLRLMSPKLITSLMTALLERSAAIRKLYATVSAQVFKVTSPKQMSRWLDFLTKLFYERFDDSTAQSAAMLAFSALTAMCSDILTQNYAHKLIPIFYLGKHLPERKMYEACWEEISSAQNFSMFLSDLLSEQKGLVWGLQCSSWTHKKAAAEALLAMLRSSKISASDLSKYCVPLSETLISLLPGAQWPGKHLVIDCWAMLISKASVSDFPPALIENAWSVLLDSLNRGNPIFKTSILSALESMHRLFPSHLPHLSFGGLRSVLIALLKSDSRSLSKGESTVGPNEINAYFQSLWKLFALVSDISQLETWIDLLETTLPTAHWPTQTSSLIQLKEFLLRTLVNNSDNSSSSSSSSSSSTSTFPLISSSSMISSHLLQILMILNDNISSRSQQAVRVATLDILSLYSSTLRHFQTDDMIQMCKALITTELSDPLVLQRATKILTQFENNSTLSDD